MLLKPPPKFNDTHEFKPLLVEIEESPVSPLGRTTFWLVICIIFFTILWSVLGQIDVVISANGRIIPDGHVKVLQPLDTGVVRRIVVKEGDRVKRGQVVIEIDPSTVDPARESSAQNLSYARLEMNRINAALGSGQLTGSGPSAEALRAQEGLLESTQAELEKQLEAKQAQLAGIEERKKSTTALLEENTALLTTSTKREQRMTEVIDLVARQDYEQVANEITSYRSKCEQANHQLAELNHERRKVEQEIEQIQAQFRRTNLQELSDKLRLVNDLNARLKESTFHSRKQKIVSPVDGYVDSLFVHTVGGVVTPAEKLLSIVPENTPLIAKVNVENKDVGWVAEGMPVSIKVDTFEYQKYGMFDGKVKLISRDSREDEKRGLVYEVSVKPTTKSLKVDGRDEPLKPGMTVVAEIKVGTRRIIEFFIYPLIKYWHEGMSVR